MSLWRHVATLLPERHVAQAEPRRAARCMVRTLSEDCCFWHHAAPLDAVRTGRHVVPAEKRRRVAALHSLRVARHAEAKPICTNACAGRLTVYRVLMDQAIVEKEALKLTPAERAVLADTLLSSLDDESTRQNEAAWGALAEQRYSEYKAGKLDAVDGTTAIQELRQRLAK